MADLQAIIDDPANKIKLDDKEAYALRHWQNSNQHEIGAAKRAEFLSLYLRGYSTDQIRKEHPTFTLGQIVHAKVIDRWDLAVLQYAERLRDSMINQVVLTTMETARTLVDTLSAVNKSIGKKARKYLETGNEADLPFPVDKVREYQALIAAFQMVTGEKPKKIEVQTSNSPPETVQSSQNTYDSDDDSEESKVLAFLAGKAPIIEAGT